MPDSSGNHWNAAGQSCLSRPCRGQIEWDDGQVCDSGNQDWLSSFPCLSDSSENSNDPEQTGSPDFQGYYVVDPFPAPDPGSAVVSSTDYCLSLPAATQVVLMAVAGVCVIVLKLF